MYVFPSKHFKRNNLNFYFRNKTGGQPAIGWARVTKVVADHKFEFSG